MGITPWPKGQIELMTFPCVKDGGTPINLTGLVPSNIGILLQPTAGGSDITGTGTVTILSAAQGIIQYLPSSADVSTAGTYNLRAQITFGSGTITSDGATFQIVTV